MPHGTKGISLINCRIETGMANVFTEAEVKALIDNGASLELFDIDVITMAYQSSMSGTTAMVLVPVTSRGVFTRARAIWLNGLEGHPGPAPNERLGMVDTLVVADRRSRKQQNYSGADLLLDMLGDREITAQCLSVEGGLYSSSFTMRKLEFARFYVLNSFIPSSRWTPPFGPGSNAHLRTIRAGSKLLINGAQGMVVGSGSLDSPESKSLSLCADMFEMDRGAIGQIDVDEGLRTANSIALAIPVTDKKVLSSVITYLKRINQDESGRGLSATDMSMAAHLKSLILKGRFRISDSDFLLGETMLGAGIPSGKATGGTASVGNG